MPNGEGKKKGRVNCLSAFKGDPHALHTGAFASDAGCVCSWEKWSSGYSGRRCTLRLHTGVSWGNSRHGKDLCCLSGGESPPLGWERVLSNWSAELATGA